MYTCACVGNGTFINNGAFFGEDGGWLVVVCPVGGEYTQQKKQ